MLKGTGFWLQMLTTKNAWRVFWLSAHIPQYRTATYVRVRLVQVVAVCGIFVGSTIPRTGAMFSSG